MKTLNITCNNGDKLFLVEVPIDAKDFKMACNHLNFSWIEYPDNTGCTKIPIEIGDYSIIGTWNTVNDDIDFTVAESWVEKLSTHGLSGHDLYKRWLKIKSRCLNEKNKRYNDYGGRGIVICDEWKNDFLSFYNWALLNGYDPKKEIDRRDNNGNYEPNNCWFRTTKENCNNTRRNIMVEHNNKSMTLMQACESVGLSAKYRTIWQNIKSGKTFLESIKSYV